MKKVRPKLAFYLPFAVFVFAIILRSLYIDTSYAFWDEATYLENAKFFASGASNYNEIMLRPPLLSLIILPLIGSEFAVRFFLVLVNSLIVLSVYYLAKEMYDEKTGLVASFLIAILPFHIIYSQYIMTDSILALMTCALAFLCVKLSKKRETKYAVLAGFLLGLTFLAKYTAVLFLPLIILPFIIKRKFRISDIALILIAFSVVILPHLIFQHLLFGSPVNFLFSAVEAVSAQEPASAGLVLWWFLDLFGLLVLPLAAGIYILAKERDLIPLYWLFSFYFFYLIIVNQGVDKPPYILWLTERFLLPLLPFFTLIASRALSMLSVRHLLIFTAAALILFMPLYQRYLQPAIDMENGIRGATRDVAAFVSSNIERNATIYCNHNCPSLAYYIPQKVEWFRSDSPEGLPKGSYLVYFGDAGSIDTEKYGIIRSIRIKAQDASVLAAK